MILDHNYTHFVSNTRDERFDVDLGRAAFLTWGIGTFQTPVGFPQSASFAQCCMLDVIEIVRQWRARLKIAIVVV